MRAHEAGVGERGGERGPPSDTRTPSTASGGHAAAELCLRSGERGRAQEGASADGRRARPACASGPEVERAAH
jgi:hypothetical protein